MRIGKHEPKRWSAALALATCACVTTTGSVPLLLQTPDSQELILEAKARGAQLYACEADPMGRLQWTLKAPEATLFDDQGQQIGRHYAGPTWESFDGSKVAGKVTASVPSPDAGAIPWLLVTATSASGGGTFGKVASIQRIDTSGGKPPTPNCSTADIGSTLRVAYQARYLFYAPRR